MKRRIFIFLSSLVLTFALGHFAQIFACSCMSTTPCQSFNYAGAVFVGKAVGAKQQRTVEDYSAVYQNSNTTGTPSEPKKLTYDVGEIYFEVEEAFYGVKKGERVTIYSGTGGGDCGYWFTRGETYLIYASFFKNDENNSTGLSTSICSGTKPLGSANADLEYLRKLSGDSKGKFFGGVQETFNFDKDDEAKAYAGLTLNFQKLETGEIFSTTTNAEGEFEINVPAGKYKIVPLLPAYAQVENYGNEDYDPTLVEVKPDACLRVWLTIESRSEVSGRLVSFDGKSLDGVEVELLDYATKRWVGDGESDADGNFVITQVPAGKYLLAVNKNIAPHAGSPFPTYFYPKSFNLSGAKILNVELGQKIKDLVFQMPPPLKIQIVTGTVVWENGKPAVNARVDMRDDLIKDSSFSDERTALTDEAGKFVVKGFTGRSYALEVSFYKYEEISEAEAKEEMEQTDKFSRIIFSGNPPRYARVTNGAARIKPFKIENKPLNFKIVLKPE